MTYRVGYVISEKKVSASGFKQLFTAASDLEFVSIDPNKALDDQGPFDAIIHKVFPDILLTRAVTSEGSGKGGGQPLETLVQRQQKNKDRMSGDLTPAAAQHRLDNVFNYIQAHHGTVVCLDPLPGISKLLDRDALDMTLQGFRVEVAGDVITVPAAGVASANPTLEEINEVIKTTGLQYPIICKPNSACGTPNAHSMTVVTRAEHFTNLASCNPSDNGYLLQQYISHSETVYKVYVIGEQSWVIARPSSKRVDPASDTDVYHFNSQVVDKAAVSTVVTDLSKPAIDVCTKQLSSLFSTSLFGYDVIKDEKDGVMYIIDVNYFPGYSGVPDRWVHITDLIRNRIQALAK